MKNNKLKSLIEFIGLDYKKECIKYALLFIIGILLGTAFYIFLKNIFLLFLGLGISLFLCYALLNKHLGMKTKLKKERDEEFINLINYFQTFIKNRNNVYQSFNKLLEYSSDWMQEKITRFLHDVDLDKSVKPFIDFASNFKLIIAKNIMLSIYQMVDEGEDNLHLSQFDSLLMQLDQSHQEQLKEDKKKSLQMLTSSPMIGAVLITIILSISIIRVMGDMINVL